MVPIAVQLLSISAEELGRPHLLKEQKESMLKALNSNIPTYTCQNLFIKTLNLQSMATAC